VAAAFIAGLVAVELVGAGNPQSKPRPTARAIEKYLAKPGDFTIVCTLFKSDPPGKVFLADIPITYDPMFLIGARVEEVTFGTSPWKAGTSIRFTIHSPTLLLGGYRFDGQRYSMTFSPFRPHGKDDEIWFKPETRYLLKWIEKASEGQQRGRA
jgi:hypothetical protein